MRTSALVAVLALLATPTFSKPVSQSPHSAPAAANAIPPAVLAALDAHPDDLVAAFLSVEPGRAAELAAPRLIEVLGDGEGPRWMTEGDKMALRRERKVFLDLTERPDAQLGATAFAGSAHTPDLTHQRWVRPCFADVSTKKMAKVLKHMTSYFNRYYHSVNGARSARWLHDHIAEIIAGSPFQTYISLEYHTHSFLQPSIVARFEPVVRNASLPLTILGAHQDSASYIFPLLSAPGADDDCSGTVSILEAFRVLANRGYIPERGPVEFHWYAAEEAGLYGSLAIAGYKKDIGAKIGAMLEFDMTAFIARNATESITLVSTQADDKLTEWTAGLAREYSTLEVAVRELGPDAGSDYMSFTRLGFPAAFATEGDPLAHGGFPGDFDPYVHTSGDRMDVNDETGVFSIDHMARFTELAIAYVVEQAGWSPAHTRADDGGGPHH
ncbi:hypothetical protein Q5752_005661 [Cryptotrichosporon argae]